MAGQKFEFSPHPDGKRFGVTFVDDTDLSTRENTEPVYDFLAQHGFWGTKTVWPMEAKRTSSFRRSEERHDSGRGTGATLEDPDYAAFVRHLQVQGFEIALHGVAAGNSTRDEIKAGLAHYCSVIGAPPTLNAFHRTNIENLYCGRHKLDSPFFRLLESVSDRSEYEGHCEGAPSFWGDIARDTFRYVRLPFHTIDEINTLRVNPSMPFLDSRRPYVRSWFAASDGADVVRFARLLSESNVDRLASQGGICVIYTHFAKGFARRHNGVVQLDQGFVRTVKSITARPEAWFATASHVLDRLAGIRALALRHQGTTLEIQNHGDGSVDGVTLRVPAGVEVRGADGTPLKTGSGSVILPRLLPGATLTLTTNRPGAQRILPRSDDISRRERRWIEHLNYRGLVRGWARDRVFYRVRQLQGGPSE